MANPFAYDATGGVYRVQGNGWVKTETATGKDGQRYANDGASWVPIDAARFAEQSPDPANTLPVQPSLPPSQTPAPAVPGLRASDDNETIPKDETQVDSLLRRGKNIARGVGGVVDQTARGVAQGAAAIAGLPVDAINLNLAAGQHVNLIPVGPAALFPALQRLGIDQIPVGGGHSIQQGLDDLNTATARVGPTASRALRRVGLGSLPVTQMLDLLPDQPPPTKPSGFAERFGNRIGQELGAAFIPVARTLSKASRAGEGIAAGTVTRDAIPREVQQAVLDPKGYVVRNAKTAALVGTAGQGTRETVDPNHKGGVGVDLADLFGSVLGLGTFAAADKVIGRAKDIGTAMFNKANFMSPGVKRDVTDKLLSAYGIDSVAGKPIDAQEMIDVIRRGAAPGSVESSINGFKPTLSYVTNSPGIAALERDQPSGSFIRRAAENRAAVSAEIDKNAPQVPAGEFRQQLDVKRDAVVGPAGERARAAQQAFEDAVSKLQPGMNAEGRGANIRGALEDALAKARAVEDEAWRPINESRAVVDMQPLADRFDNIYARLSSAERNDFVPADLAGIPAGLVERGPQAIGEMTGLSSAFKARIRAIRNAGGNPAQERVLQQYVDAIDQTLGGSVPPELRNAYDQARAVSTNLNDRFNRPGTAVRDTLRPASGPYQTAVNDSGVSRRFMNPPDTRALINEAGGDPRVNAALRDQTVEDLIRGNNLANPAKTERFVQERGGVMDHLPALRDEIRGASAAGQNARVEQEAYDRLRKDFGDTSTPGRNAVAKYLKYDNERAGDAIKGVIASPKPGATMDELLAFVGNDPQAVQGARRAYWEYAASRGRAGITDFIGGDPAHRAVVERLYRDDPEQLKRVDQLMRIMYRQSIPTGAPIGAINEGFQAPSTASIAAALWAAERGIVNPAFSVLYLGGKAGRDNLKTARELARAKIEAQALADPDFAAALLAENNPANRAALRRGATGWLGREASVLINAINDLSDGKKDPVVDAVTRSGKADKQGR